MITSNTGPHGNLETDAIPDPQTGLSLAMCLFGRRIKDFISTLPGQYEPPSNMDRYIK